MLKKDKKSNSCSDTQKITRIQSNPGTPTKKSNIFKRILCLIKKNCYFNFEKVFLITFSKGNGRAKVEENNSNDTLVCDDDAHKVVLCAYSPFF